MKEEHIWYLIGKQLSGEATPSEISAIEEWLQLHPEHPVLYESILGYWQTSKESKGQNAIHAWQKLRGRMEQNQAAKGLLLKKRRMYRWPLTAAAVLLLLSAWWLFPYLQNTWWQLSTVQQENSRGARSTLLLPDGSKVWLNADSRLSYPRNYGADSRTVYLRGEAFFEVVKNAELPFYIHLEDHLISVLGTSFNVKSYEEDRLIETSVLTGEVLLLNTTAKNLKSDSIRIRPNQKVSVDMKTGNVLKVTTDSREDMAWTEGRLVFKNETLEEIARTLERTYDVPVSFAEPSLRHCRLTATFQHKSLKEILELIAMTEDFTYELDKVALLKGTGCQPSSAGR